MLDNCLSDEPRKIPSSTNINNKDYVTAIKDRIINLRLFEVNFEEFVDEITVPNSPSLLYAMCICRANLDAMCGRAVSTIEGHAAATKRAVWNSRAIRKTPPIPPRGANAFN
jgi:hypothetical protein